MSTDRAASGSESKFDAYASNYRSLHERSVSASGEDPEYFARYKVDCLRRIGAQGPVLDFGCGIGGLARHLVREFREVHGTDPSRESLALARDEVPRARFWESPADAPDRHFGSVVLAGVLHHVSPGDRGATLAKAFSKLRPGGRLVVFEHNPWNPLTRRAVRDCPFDDDAILLGPWELKRRLATAGFVDVRLRYIVFFPRALRALRRLEPHLSWLMLGAQTMTVAQRPAEPGAGSSSARRPPSSSSTM